MKIECPACAHKQTIAPVVCSGCNENFAGYLFRKYRKPLMSATTALIVGGYGGYKVTDKLREEVRYPLRAEYAIVEVSSKLQEQKRAPYAAGGAPGYCELPDERDLASAKYAARQLVLATAEVSANLCFHLAVNLCFHATSRCAPHTAPRLPADPFTFPASPGMYYSAIVAAAPTSTGRGCG